MSASLLPNNLGRDLREDACDARGRLKIMPKAYYQGTTQSERSALALLTGNYLLPTFELVDWIREQIAGRSAIEIGSGNGILADALGIPATDNRMQENPDIAAHYAAMGQPVITYGDNVEKLDAQEAIAKYRPQVVVAAWVTHRYDPSRHLAGGNMFGVDEGAVIDACEDYVFIGNTQVHAGKPIWDRPHRRFDTSAVFSRATNGSPELAVVWHGNRRGLDRRING